MNHRGTETQSHHTQSRRTIAIPTQRRKGAETSQCIATHPDGGVDDGFQPPSPWNRAVDPKTRFRPASPIPRTLCAAHSVSAWVSNLLLGVMINWIYIYKLGRWDQKFGGEWDNFLLAFQIVAILAFLAAIGVATGLANGLRYWSDAAVYVARWISPFLPRHTILDLALSAVVLAVLLAFLEVHFMMSYGLVRGPKVDD